MLRLAGSGTSSREIAVVLGIARSTVQDNLRRAAAIGLSWPLPGELTDDALENKLFARNGVKQRTRRRAEPNWADLAVELKKPGVTLLILWEEYRGSHPDGYGYSRFCELFRSFEQRLSPTMRQEHAAGDKVFVDYSARRSRSLIETPARSVRRRSSWQCWVRPASPMPKQPGPRHCLIGLVHTSGCFVSLMAFPD
ncbi:MULTISPECIES: hypothetical protein [unclassified Mesorhizobium]|uniref:hypothetical protein n=1 Tax=unclassified Mesorhizobium TaxID=325217 RepID=UPI001FEF4E64|nr:MULTISPECIES: hypothetical protein [unclassified Mesorhizobium]